MGRTFAPAPYRYSAHGLFSAAATSLALICRHKRTVCCWITTWTQLDRRLICSLIISVHIIHGNHRKRAINIHLLLHYQKMFGHTDTDGRWSALYNRRLHYADIFNDFTVKYTRERALNASEDDWIGPQCRNVLQFHCIYWLFYGLFDCFVYLCLLVRI